MAQTNASPPAASDSARPLVEWTFERDGDSQGWRANLHLADVKVTGGALSCRGAGSDPLLELQAPFEIPAAPWQAIEVRMKASRDGIAEIFWSNTNQGRYGGFAQEKSTRFRVVGDNRWSTYRLLPFWHPEGRIVRLRFDVFDGAEFAIDWLRIVALPVPAGVARPEFDFSTPSNAWRWIDLGRLVEAPATSPSAERFLAGPPVDIDAEQRNYVSVCLTAPPLPAASARPAARATLYFATAQDYGLKSFGFPIETDGREHVYNLDLLAAPAWHGRIVALGLDPGRGAGPRGAVQWLRVSDQPQGPPELKVVAFGLEDALPRAGSLAALKAIVANTGGADARRVAVDLNLPPGVELAGATGVRPLVTTLRAGEESVWQWSVVSAQPRTGEATLSVTADGAESGLARASLAFTPRPKLGRSRYVPEPKPVRGPRQVGVYYFPGWKTASQWHPIQRFPERKPVLGWYREGDPEVVDWQIKWAVEHGLTFFAYDWYWSQGARQLEHALHDGYFQARYRHLLKFCLLWANHNAPGTSSLADCVAVTRYWIANYFRRPEHLTIDGRPVVIIFSTDRLSADLGATRVKAAGDAMRAECRQAGFPGLYLVACVGDAGQARQAAAEGYDAVTAYTWPALEAPDGQFYAPYATLLPGYRRNWAHLLETAGIPLVVPVSGGWDSRPWHGENNYVRFGRTPDLFQQHLAEAERLIATAHPPSATANLVLIEAWNEFGEGAYIEPHQEFGFGYLDAIRAVFTRAPQAHTDVTPADLGLGPYDVAPDDTTRTAWEFNTNDDGWSNVMDLADVRAEAGALSGRTTGNDPAFFGPPMQAPAGEFRTVALRMKLRRADGQPFRDRAQLFWRTSRLTESEATSERFEVVGDGEWHAYTVPVAQNRRWRGSITRLRLDPCNQRDVQVSVDGLRLVRPEDPPPLDRKNPADRE